MIRRSGISALRRKYHRDVSMEAFNTGDGNSIEVAVEGESSELGFESKNEILRALQRLITTELTDKQRLAVRALLSHFATDEIAEQLKMNRNAEYKLIYDARQKVLSRRIRSLDHRASLDQLSEAGPIDH